MKNRINRHLTLQASQQAVEYSLMKKIVPLQMGFSNNNQACYLPFRFNSVDILKRIIFTIFMSSHFDITDISLYYFWGNSITKSATTSSTGGLVLALKRAFLLLAQKGGIASTFTGPL